MISGSRKWLIRLVSCIASGFCITTLPLVGMDGAIVTILVLAATCYLWFAHIPFEYPLTQLTDEQLRLLPTGELTVNSPTKKSYSQRVACQICADGLVFHSIIGDRWRVYTPYYCRANIKAYSLVNENGRVGLIIWNTKSTCDSDHLMIWFDAMENNDALEAALKTVMEKCTV